MSSILAIKVYVGENGCIYFGSDKQKTTYDGDRPIAKTTTNKIWTGPNWLLAHAGTVTEYLDEFRKRLEGRRKVGSEPWGPERSAEMISRAVNSGADGSDRVFREIAEVSRRMKKEGYDSDDPPEYLFAVNNPLRLFYIDDSGNMYTYKELCKRDGEDPSELEFLTIGSGADHMKKYIQTKLEDDEDETYIGRFNHTRAPREIWEILNQPIKRDPGSSAPVVIAGLTEDHVFFDKDRFAKAAAKAQLDEADDFGMEIHDYFEKEE